jgi:hypothetical protein
MRMLFRCLVGWSEPAAPAESGDEQQQQQARRLGKKKAVRRMRSATARLRSLSLGELSRTLASSGLHAFTQAELRAATRGVSGSQLIGEGGFGPVYRGFLDERLRPGELEPQHVAVKFLDADGQQGHREWLVRTDARVHCAVASMRACLMLTMDGWMDGCRPRWCTWGC